MTAAARIGPNALLQLLPVLAGSGSAGVFEAAGVAVPPDDAGMWPEAEVAAVHRRLRSDWPDQAPEWLAAAGRGTGAYILAHRIPRPAQRLLRALPGAVAAPILAGAIGRNAWTFAGSGCFRVAAWRPLAFEIAANPLVSGEVRAAPACHWHVAVFAALFDALVWPGAVVRETACCACGDAACRFEIAPPGRRR
jgi:divinyl protochlorophyllide a 8-vinyl-reductase